ncbi:UNVERIFIED_CONTAM: hypothetical protein PYX00_007246 [Menopon gallinae]|uniref:rRNA adenine N(6)-methyltransferase n=1 Tax=Menopon gallinae TaxID=328185 RepID=A0AAW2HJ49_9NEOP
MIPPIFTPCLLFARSVASDSQRAMKLVPSIFVKPTKLLPLTCRCMGQPLHTTRMNLGQSIFGEYDTRDPESAPVILKKGKLKKEIKTSFQVTYGYTLKEEVAERMGKVILATRSSDSVLIEVNPGLGLITNYLLKNGVPKIVVYDNVLKHEFSEVYYDNMAKIELQQLNLLDFSPTNYITQSWNLYDELQLYADDKALLYAVGLNRICIKSIMRLIIFVNYEFCKNMEFVLLVAENVLQSLISLGSKFSKVNDYTFMNLLFKIEVIDFFPVEYFVPSFPEDKCMVLIKMRRRMRLPLSVEHLHSLYSFSYVLGQSKYSSIVQTLEKLYPKIGLKLIAAGLGVTTQVSELTPNEIVSLFKIIKDMPGETGALTNLFDSENPGHE